MPTDWKLSALQKAADEVVVRQTLRTSGIFATIFGVLAILGGVAPPTDLLLLIVGAVLALTGLWNLTNPHAIGLALSAAALIAVGLYNVWSTVAAPAGQQLYVGWAVLGAWQVMWGVQGFGRFRRFRDAFESSASEEDRVDAKRALDALRRAKPKSEMDVLQFSTGGFQPRVVRARLMPDSVVCLIGGNYDVLVLSRDRFALEPVGEVKPGRAVKVKARMGETIVATTVTAEVLRRYQAWRQPARETLPRAA
jgi:hypothetical protein